MKYIPCGCGCGSLIAEVDSRGRHRRYIPGHNNRRRTEAQRAASSRNIREALKVGPWNKGKSYVFSIRKVYANRGAWNKAMRRLYPDACMRCGWNAASCDTHHIVPKADGGEFSLANGIILCPNCHRLADTGLLTAKELIAIKAGIEVTGTIV